MYPPDTMTPTGREESFNSFSAEVQHWHDISSVMNLDLVNA